MFAVQTRAPAVCRGLCSASSDPPPQRQICPVPASPQPSCGTQAMQGDHRDWAGSSLASDKQVTIFGVLNAFLLEERKGTSPLQITLQRSQKKYRAKHAPKPAKGAPPAPQGSGLGWGTIHGTAARICGSHPLPRCRFSR